MERVERVDRHFQVTVNLCQLEASLPLSHKEEIKSPFAFLFSSHLSRTGFQLPPPPGIPLPGSMGSLEEPYLPATKKLNLGVGK